VCLFVEENGNFSSYKAIGEEEEEKANRKSSKEVESYTRTYVCANTYKGRELAMLKY